jgi:hypothetical protein
MSPSPDGPAKIQMAPQVSIHYNKSAVIWIFGIRFGGTFLYHSTLWGIHVTSLMLY